MNKTKPARRYVVDVAKAEVREIATGRVMNRLKYRGPRESTIADEVLTRGRLPLLEAVAIHTGAFDGRVDIRGVRKWGGEVKSRLKANFRPYGVGIDFDEKIGVPTFVASRTACSKSLPYVCTTDEATTRLESASRAVLAADYKAAVDEALGAIELCPKLVAAHQLVGVGCFRYGVLIEDESLNKSILSLGLRQLHLKEARMQLARLWKACPKDYLKAATIEALEAFDDELEELADVFEAARKACEHNAF